MSKRFYKCTSQQSLLEALGRLVAGKRYFIVVDQRILALHQTTLTALLKLQNCLGSYALTALEKEKKLTTVAAICDSLLALNIDRSDYLIAIGGGITSDIAAFSAAITKRGINLIIVPTTLLAMVDAAIGGKAAVNTVHGKNSLGCFYQPKQIVLATDFLATLPDAEWQNGRGECLKYSYIDRRFKSEIVQLPLAQFKEQVIAQIDQFAEYKQSVVERDLHDVGQRRILNFGHSFGHALEHVNQNRQLGHGQAVMLGIAISLFFSVELFNLERAVLTDYINWLQQQPWYDSSYYRPYDEIAYYLQRDKKNSEQMLTMVLLDGPFNPQIVKLAFARVEQIYRGYYREIADLSH